MINENSYHNPNQTHSIQKQAIFQMANDKRQTKKQSLAQQKAKKKQKKTLIILTISGLLVEGYHCSMFIYFMDKSAFENMACFFLLFKCDSNATNKNPFCFKRFHSICAGIKKK